MLITQNTIIEVESQKDYAERAYPIFNSIDDNWVLKEFNSWPRHFYFSKLSSLCIISHCSDVNYRKQPPYNSFVFLTLNEFLNGNINNFEIY